MLKIFKENQPIAEEELTKEIRKLQADSHEITRGIHFEKDPRKIEEMQKQREKITQQLNPLLEKRRELQKQQKINNTKNLITEKLSLLRVEGNGHPFNVNSDLTVDVVYFPCGHHETVTLNRFIPFTQSRLWQDLVEEGNIPSIHGSLNCSECRKQQLKALEEHKYTHKPLGFVSWSLRFLK